MSVLLDGKKLADEMALILKREIANQNRAPKIAVFLVGESVPSKKYVELKIKRANEIGIEVELIKLAETTTQEEIISLIEKKNDDKKVDAILVQVPLPNHLDQTIILNTIDPLKDVDAMGMMQIGLHTMGITDLIPCTAKGVVTLLKHYGIAIAGSNILIINRSGTVGLPLFRELVGLDATVTVAHKFTKNLAEHTRAADIVIVAAGYPKLITQDMVKPTSVVIDVGANFVDGKLIGDVDFENLNGHVLALSPNPGGVGPMTVISLMENILICYQYSIENDEIKSKTVTSKVAKTKVAFKQIKKPVAKKATK